MSDTENTSDKKLRREIRKRSVMPFVFLLLFFCFCIFFWKWLYRQPKEAGALQPLRIAMNTNEKIFSGIFSGQKLEKEYPKSEVDFKVRVNGNAGMKSQMDTASWSLGVVRNAESTALASDTLFISMEELKKLPKTEVIFDFKCIEGWSQVTWWGGVRFSDFAAHYNLGTKSSATPGSEKDFYSYAGLITPDREYYVGIDIASMMHPQTILCYEMNGRPLPLNQGAPLRLIIPVKYGIKHIKRIGTLYFTDSRPPDYWYERGYDYYAGL